MPRTVLIIDDSEAIRAKVVSALRDRQVFDTFLQAESGIDGFKLLVGQPVDLVLCDVVMPQTDGFVFLGLKHGRPEFNEVPVIMLTGEEDVKTKVRGLDAGASDYLVKPFFPEELVARVRVHLKIKSLQDELREKNVRLETLTRTDELTSLNNRRFFMEALRQEYARAQRYQTPMALAMIDIDHFKRVNDAHGHQAGDRALVMVAGTLAAALRSQDILGRYGGEEFAVIMPQTGAQGAQMGLERCRARIEAAPVMIDNRGMQITVSIGVVHYPRPDIPRLDALIARADAALYAAKGAGRNCVMLDAAVTPAPPAPPAPPLQPSALATDDTPA